MSGGGGHLSNLCRVCLKPPKSTEELDTMIIYDEEEELTYYDCLKIITHMDLAEGCGTPEKLCKICGLELQMAYDFYKKVEHAKRQVMQYMDSHRNSNPEDARVQSRLKAAVIPSKPICDDLPSTSDYLTDEHRTDDFEIDCEVLDEQHLDLDDYEAIEEEDEETMQSKVEKKSVDEVYLIDTIAVNEDGDEEDEEEEVENIEAIEHSDEHYEDERMSWQKAVVVVANEEHLPLNDKQEDAESEALGRNASDTAQQDDLAAAMEDVEYYVQDIDHESRDDDDKEQAPSSDRPMKTRHQMAASQPKERIRFKGKFRCDHCQKIFPNHSRMVLHRRTHEPDRPKYECEHCGRFYSTKQAMEVHIRAVHTKTGFSCPICDKIYAIKKGLEVHMRFHTGDFPYVCDLCGRKFAQMCHLNTHKDVKHNSVRFCCEYPNCGKFFTSSSSLRNHEFKHSSMPFECEFCSRGYPSKSKLRVHIKRKHERDLTLDQLEHMRKFHVARSKLNVVRVVECTGEYGFKLADTISGAQYCDAAPQYTEDDVLSEGGQQQPVPAYVEPQAALAEEDRIERTYSEGDSVKPPESPGHLEDEDYQDPGYSETPLHFKEEDFTEPSFAEMPALFKDEHHTHPQYSAMPAQLKGEDRAEPSCSAAPAQLEVEVHSEPPEFVPHYEPHPGGGPANVACDVCQKVFPNRSKMMWHRRMHDENRIRYRCPVSGCDKLYASKQSCNFHYKQAHLDQGVMCPICHKLFAIRQTLEVHLRYHTKNFPYECELCQKKFGQKGHLTTHMQVKHYNLRYMCSEKGCGKAFKNSMSLRNHRFVHTEMPFRCAFCDRGYPQKSKLKVHIIVKHNMELSMADLETMRRFKETRTRHSFVKLDASADA